MNATDDGNDGKSRKPSLVTRCSRPGIVRSAGFAPLAMTMARVASSVAPPTLRCAGPMNRATSWNVSIPARARPARRFSGYGSVNVRLNAMRSAQSIANPLGRTPFPERARAASTAAAAPTNTFFGSQPRSAHVPPNGRLSIIATVHPASRQRNATLPAAEPEPMTMRSNVRVIEIRIVARAWMLRPQTCARCEAGHRSPRRRAISCLRVPLG